MQDYCRSEELWFEDGNIVLEAEGIVFRVYRGNLARHSPVFAAMLSFPQPAQNELSESLDGCLIVHMPDAAEHLRYFLTALNDFGFSERIAKASLAEVNGVLRLAAKYDVAYLRLRAAARMRDWFPDSLDVFRRLGYTTGTPPTAEDLFASLEVSCAAGMHICLPVILFRICSVGLADILAPGNLDPATQLLVMEARETLSVRFHTEVWRWLYETPGCTAPLHCPQFRAKLSLRFEEVRFFTDFCKMFSLAPSAAQLHVWRARDH